MDARKLALLFGALLMAAGHFLMAFDFSFLLALLCLLTGVGCFKGNLASQVGDLYAPADLRRADLDGADLDALNQNFRNGIELARRVFTVVDVHSCWYSLDDGDLAKAGLRAPPPALRVKGHNGLSV